MQFLGVFELIIDLSEAFDDLHSFSLAFSHLKIFLLDFLSEVFHGFTVVFLVAFVFLAD